MSEYIPFDIQVQILKRLPVKSLIQFRSVSKTWKSLIDSPRFIARYSAQGTQIQHLLVNTDYEYYYSKNKYYLITDDDSFPRHKVSVPLPDNFFKDSNICGCSHGLLCFAGYIQLSRIHFSPTGKAVIWNPSIRKAVSVDVPNVGDDMYDCNFGFGVCRGDPKIVKIRHVRWWEGMESISSIPQQVEIFTLSARGWRSSYGNLPRKTMKFNSCQRVEEVDGFLYWLATDAIDVGGEFESYSNLIVSFDLMNEEFTEVKIPDSLAYEEDITNLSMYKLRDSLAVVHHPWPSPGEDFSTVWRMEDGVPKSFTKLFTINTPHAFIMGFRKSGEPVIENEEEEENADLGLLYVYDPHSKQIQIDDLGIDETGCAYALFHYIETLLLLDHPDLVVYNDI